MINDWRRFKLESMDQESLAPAKRELLRQMSSPQNPNDSSKTGVNRKVFRLTNIFCVLLGMYADVKMWVTHDGKISKHHKEDV